MAKPSSTRRASAVAGGAEIARPVAGDGTVGEALSEWQRKITDLMERLTQGVSLESAERTSEQQARWLLAQVTHKVLRKDARLREWYKRIRRRRGSTIARVAVMRKLATIIWHMLSKRKTYAECRGLAEAGTNEREKQECG